MKSKTGTRRKTCGSMSSTVIGSSAIAAGYAGFTISEMARFARCKEMATRLVHLKRPSQPPPPYNAAGLSERDEKQVLSDRPRL